MTTTNKTAKELTKKLSDLGYAARLGSDGWVKVNLPFELTSYWIVQIDAKTDYAVKYAVTTGLLTSAEIPADLVAVEAEVVGRRWELRIYPQY